MSSIRFALITVSDRCSRGEAEDLSGPALENVIANHHTLNAVVAVKLCVPDDLMNIQKALLDCCESGVDVILTTGGTGVAPRDVTPDATSRVILKEIKPISIAMTVRSLNSTPFAMLSRAICGVRDKTIIINLPGSKKGALECFSVVAPVLEHAVQLIHDDIPAVTFTHKTMFNETSKVPKDMAAFRDRKSVWPMIPLEEATKLIMGSVPEPSTEKVPLEGSLGRILSEDIISAEPLPPFRASIKDGYAMIASDTETVLRVIGNSSAGSDPNTIRLALGTCVRVNTGAPVPLEADCVVQVEDTLLIEYTSDGEELKIEILTKPTVGQDIREIGSDISVGEKLLCTGILLGSSELGILATVGVNLVPVYKCPLVGVLSTGNELVEVNEKLRPGTVRDSNRPTLLALFKEQGFSALDMGIAPDVPDHLLAKIKKALQKCDVLVTTGSVSMGDKDYLKAVLQVDLGATIKFGRVDLKPGKPTTFATLNGADGKLKLVFALPGNPSSAVVTSLLFVIPALKKMSGHSCPHPTSVSVKMTEGFKTDTRPEFKRAYVHFSTSAELPTAHVTGNQISSRLTSFASANALLKIPPSEQVNQVGEGAIVEALIIGKI